MLACYLALFLGIGVLDCKGKKTFLIKENIFTLKLKHIREEGNLVVHSFAGQKVIVDISYL